MEPSLSTGLSTQREEPVARLEGTFLAGPVPARVLAAPFPRVGRHMFFPPGFDHTEPMFGSPGETSPRQHCSRSFLFRHFFDFDVSKRTCGISFVLGDFWSPRIAPLRLGLHHPLLAGFRTMEGSPRGRSWYTGTAQVSSFFCAPRTFGERLRPTTVPFPPGVSDVLSPDSLFSISLSVSPWSYSPPDELDSFF